MSRKEQLVQEIEKLPEEQLQEVLNFVGYLRAQDSRKITTMSQKDLDPQGDPVLKLFGIANVEPFSQNIDQDLYGE